MQTDRAWSNVEAKARAMQTDHGKAWANVEAEARAMQTYNGFYFWDSTDDDMRNESDATLLEWVDITDTAFSVVSAANFREAVLFYIAIRCNGEGIDPQDYADALASIAG